MPAVPDELIASLRELPDVHEVLDREGDLFVYESDGLTLARGSAAAVCFPATTRGVQEIVRVCNRFERAFVARGAGTGLSGGATPVDGCIIVECSRMNEVLSIDAVNCTARVQPGLINAHLSDAVRELGLHYAPDPSSQTACTIGGNIAENSGGPHTLKYGTTSRRTCSSLECRAARTRRTRPRWVRRHRVRAQRYDLARCWSWVPRARSVSRRRPPCG